MAAMLIDSMDIDLARGLIVSGKYDAALAALDTLTARSPRSGEEQATRRQRNYLNSLTGLQAGGHDHWANMLLPLKEAGRMISELLTEGETTYRTDHYRLSETAQSKRKRTTEIPW